MKTFKKALACFLVVAMFLTAAPLSGFVGLQWPDLNLPEWNLPDIDFNFSADAATIVKFGSCGTNVTYTLDSDGLLTIAGTGAMRNYSSPSSAPWYSNRSAIKTVIIENGVTSIGEYAFYWGSSLTSVTIPDSVASIGYYAFSFCDSLPSVTFSANSRLISIGYAAFYDCTSLTSVTIPDSVTSIGRYAFQDCTKLTSVTIPDSVTSIGDEAFGRCTSLTEITVESGNKHYSNDEYGVLFNKDKTTLIQYPIGNERTIYSIPDSVTSIGDSAFEDCTKLTSVTIGDSVTSIGDRAFYHCTSLTSVTFSANSRLTSIGDYAFLGCTSLTSITIPDSVTSIGHWAFNNCTSLTEITVESGNKHYSNDEYGVLFNKDKTTLIQYPIGNERTTYSIPDSVTSIGGSAFSYCDSLTSVTIPDSVTSIGDSAFYNCTSLTSITILNPDCEIYYIEFTIYEGATIYGYTCSTAQAYAERYGRTFVSLGGAPTTHEHSYTSTVTLAATCCTTGVKTYTCECEDSYIEVIPFDFTNHVGGTEVRDAREATEDAPGYTGDTYCLDCNTKIADGEPIPYATKIIASGTCGNNLFWTYNNEYVLTISGSGDMWNYVSSTGAPWNNYKNKIKTLSLSSAITSIGNYAFSNCNLLESIIINDLTTPQGELSVPETTMNTGHSAEESFTYHDPYDPSSLNDSDATHVYEEPLATQAATAEYAVLHPTSTNEIIDDKETSTSTESTTIQKDESTIPDDTAIQDSSIIMIKDYLPASVKSVGDHAFEHCCALESIIIPARVSSIGDQAFWGCSALNSITILNPICLIDNSAFTITSNVIKGYDNSTAQDYADKHDHTFESLGEAPYRVYYSGNCGNNLKWKLDSNRVLTIYGTGSMKNYDSSSYKAAPWYSIRQLIKTVEMSEGITHIGNYAFDECDFLTSVSIPNSVQSVGYGAFYWCNSLDAVYIEDLTAWCNIAFDSHVNNPFNLYLNDELIKKLIIPNTVISINNFAFKNCASITSVSVPSSVTNIGYSAFENCSSLKAVYITNLAAWCNIAFLNEFANPLSNAHYLYLNNIIVTKLNIPNSVTQIKQYAFHNNAAITHIDIPNSVKNIGQNAFSGCSSLTSINLPNSITSINENVFSGCIALVTVHIPSDVTSIGYSAFSGCTSLKSIDIPSNVTNIGSSAFSGCTSLTSIDIPSNVTNIGSSAFYGCTSLASIDIPSNVTSIRDATFSGCTSLASIDIPSNVTSIGSSAFYGCTSLATVTIPNKMTIINRAVFSNCTSLASVSIPISVKTIDYYAFYGCSALADVYYEGSAVNWDVVLINDYNNSLLNAEIHFGSYVEACEHVWNDGVIKVQPSCITEGIKVYTCTICKKTKTVSLPVNDAHIWNDGVVTIEPTYNKAGVKTYTCTLCGETKETLFFTNVDYVSPVRTGTGGTTGTYYAFTTAVGQILGTDNYKFEILSTGGSQVNIEMIEDGDIKMAIVQNDVMNYAYNGTNGFETPITSFSAVACVYPEVCQLIATKASGITSVADLAGKNVAVGDIGSGVYYNATQILAAAGLDIDTDINKITASFGDSATQLKDGSIDAAFITAGTPTTAITELATSTDVVVVELGEDVIANLQEQYSFYAKHEMTDKDYAFVTEPVNTVSIMATFVVSNDMPEEQVYEITKGLWEKVAGNTSIHPRAAQMDIANATAVGAVPLHPGAQRYYEEVGIPGNDDIISDSGSCGTNVTWKLTASGTLVISGMGAMDDYVSFSAIPWYNYRTSIKKIIIEDGVTTIGRMAFIGCSAVTSVSIASTVTAIGYSAFSGCSSLVSITLPDGLKTIGNSAFYCCSALKSIFIPASVIMIGSTVFYGCESLTDITVAETNAKYSSLYGVLYDKNKTVLICYPLGKTDATFVVPNGVVSISYFAFGNCKHLQSVTIADTVTVISYSAFSGCSALTEIILPDAVREIGSSAFFNCISLISISIGSGLRTIDTEAFYGCNNLKDVYYNGGEAEWNKIEIGSYNSCLLNAERHYKYINSGKFVTGQTWQILSDGTLVITGVGMLPDFTKDTAFFNQYNITKVVISEGITRIGNYMFYGCKTIVTIVIADSVTIIGSNAFENCTALVNVTLGSGITSISGFAFYNCVSITVIVIPDSVTVIGERAFGNCTGLINITLGKKVHTISAYAFYNCINITVIIIPNSVTVIGTGAFGNCSSLVEVTLGSNVTIIGSSAFYNCISIVVIVIPNSVTQIGDKAFGNCTALINITIGQNVSQLGDFVFYNCIRLEIIIVHHLNLYFSTDANGVLYNKNQTNLIYYPGGKTNTSFTIPNTVTHISIGAFAYCIHLTIIIMPISVVHIGDYAFDYCDHLTQIKYAGTQQEWNKITIGINISINITIIIYVNAYCRHENTTTLAAVAATCSETGLTEGKKCTDCGLILVAQSVIPKTEHTEELRNKKAPTDTEDGYTGDIYCSVCNQLLKQGVVIPAGTLLGDIDGDGRITAADSRQAMQYIVGLEPFTEVQKYCAEIEIDGKITPEDARYILRGAIGLENTADWPVEHTSFTTAEPQGSVRISQIANQSDNSITILVELIDCVGLTSWDLTLTDHNDILTVKTITIAEDAKNVDKSVHNSIYSVWNYDMQHVGYFRESLWTAEEFLADSNADYQCVVNSDEFKLLTFTLSADDARLLNHHLDLEISGELCFNGKRLPVSASLRTEPDKHITGELLYTVPGTCISNGYNVYLCAGCGDMFTVETNYDYSIHGGNTELRGTKTVSCLEDGYTGDLYCLACNTVVLQGCTIPAIGTHTWDIGTVIKEPTYDTEGTIRFICLLCKAEKTEILEKLERKFTDSDKAILRNNIVICLPYLHIADLVSQGDGVVFIDKNGKPLAADDYIGTGAVMTFEDGTQYYIVALGDVDGDGEVKGDGSVSSSDARSTLRNAVSLEEFTILQNIAADVDGSGKVDAADARLILRAAVNLEDPAQWLAKVAEH